MGLIFSYFFRARDSFYGQHEVYVASSDCSQCEHKPEHQNMILVREFTKYHLPERYRDDEDLCELVKSIASLTVRLKANYVSKRRPRYIYGTNKEYPLYERRGTETLRTGTGRVGDVVKRSKGCCTCKRCRLSMTPSRVWWSVCIFTSTHIVMDDEEAKNTTCTLFFDDTQDTSRRVDFVGGKMIWGSRTVELALLEMDTCNEEVAKNLYAEIKRFNANWKILRGKYEDKNDLEELVVIVSHPHGGAKRVSVGFGVDVGQEMNLGYSKYIYTTPTCMGSCGAPVYVLGKDWFLTEFVHSGTLKTGVPIKTSEIIDKSEIPEIYNRYNNYSARWYN